MKSLRLFLESLLMEGGAAGHMLHPWQLDKVVYLTDVLNWYYDVVKMFHTTEKKAFVKIDGNNASIRFVDGEFALDRLTKDPSDIAGVKLKDVNARFGGNAFGYDTVVASVLEMFDDAIPVIKPYLKKLGLLDNDQLMLNVEYVAGKTNKVTYNTNFITIHGLLEIQTNARGIRSTVAVPYDQSVLDKMADVLNDKFAKYGFECCTQFPTIMTTQPDIDGVLNSTLEIKSFGKKKVKDWVKEYADVPIKKTATVKMVDGTRKSATAIQLMNDIRNGVDITSIVDPKGIETAVICFLMMYLNCEIGYAVLDCFENNKLGKGSNQEGIVITDTALNGTAAPVKITGKFIYR